MCVLRRDSALVTERAGTSIYACRRDGSMDMNILIRSLQLDGRALTLRAGAGIVADSIPERELDETRAKARGVLRALSIEA